MDGNHPFPYAENGFADPFGRETEARSSSVRKSSLDKKLNNFIEDKLFLLQFCSVQ